MDSSRTDPRVVEPAGVSCAAPPAGDRHSRGSRFRGLVGDLLLCVAIAAVLTAIFDHGGVASPARLGIAFLVYLTITLGIGLTVSQLYRWLYPVLQRRVRGPLTRFLLHTALIVAGVAVGGEIAVRAVHLIGGPPPDALRWDVLRIGLVVSIVATGLTFAYERLREHARTVELREQQARQKALHAQLEALQARTNPHFLFNTLNTVAGLIEEDPKAAERMLERLAGLFRYSLAGSRTTWVRLDEELRAVRDYLGVESIRFGDRLRSNVEVEPGAESVLVPPLILQPLVENAVLHGIGSRKDGGEVRVLASRRDGTLVLQVADDGPGPGGSSHRGAGTALDDLRERLRLVYGGDAAIESSTAEGGGYHVRVRLPLVTEPA